jgi:cyclopropane fatty-acyl-phospholipid synthase-like methyltransferase
MVEAVGWRRFGTFIRSLIFPGGSLPSVEVIARYLARHTDLRIADLHELTPHYPETLRRWRANIERAGGRLHRLGYDERFRRLWRLYLAYCEAGFDEGRIASCRRCWPSRGGGRRWSGSASDPVREHVGRCDPVPGRSAAGVF